MSDSALFFTCSVIECIGRTRKLERGEVVKALGETVLRRIYRFADVLHCEPLEKVADDFIRLCNIPEGTYDNVAACRYTVPDCWTIGNVYQRLIEDAGGGDVIETLIRVYTSWLSREICQLNSDLYYQPRDYLAECWRQGKIAL